MISNMLFFSFEFSDGFVQLRFLEKWMFLIPFVNLFTRYKVLRQAVIIVGGVINNNV